MLNVKSDGVFTAGTAFCCGFCAAAFASLSDFQSIHSLVSI